jgi:hypothetical protein
MTASRGPVPTARATRPGRRSMPPPKTAGLPEPVAAGCPVTAGSAILTARRLRLVGLSGLVTR